MATLWRLVRSFGLFWWDFIVGDDITLAVAVAVGLAAVAAVATTHVPAWWALPAVWAVALFWSLHRATRRR